MELFSELPGDGLGRVPVARFAGLVRLAGHTHIQALVGLQDFEILHHKAVVEFYIGKAQQVALGLDGPDAHIQLHRRSLLNWALVVLFRHFCFLLSSLGPTWPEVA